MSIPSYDYSTPSADEHDDTTSSTETDNYASAVVDDALEDTEVEDNADDEVNEDETTKPKSRRSTTSRSSKLTAAQVRRVLAQADVIDSLGTNTRHIMAAVLNSGTGLEELVVATLSASKGAAAALSDIDALARESNPYAKMLAATIIAGDKDNARRVWGVLSALGKVEGGIPAKEVVAGQRIAEGVDSLTNDDLTSLALVSSRLGA